MDLKDTGIIAIFFVLMMILWNIVSIRSEVQGINIMINGCGCENILQQDDMQMFEEYVPSSESVA